MSLKVFFTSIYGFLPHLLFHSSIHATFRLTYEKHKGLCGTFLKHSKRHYQGSLKTTVRSFLSLINNKL